MHLTSPSELVHHRIADGVRQLAGRQASFSIPILLEDVLVDAGTRWAAGRIWVLSKAATSICRR